MSDHTTVLVLTSDEPRLRYLCDQLAADGYRAVGARAVGEARVRARLDPPAVLLLGGLAERHQQWRLLRAIRAGCRFAREGHSDLDQWIAAVGSV